MIIVRQGADSSNDTPRMDEGRTRLAIRTAADDSHHKSKPEGHDPALWSAKMADYSCKDIAELAYQLTISPVRHRTRQLDGIETLLSMVEKNRSYPYDLICYHITGYRNRRKEDQARAAVIGSKLIPDLVQMAEDITRDSGLTMHGLPGKLYSHESTAEKLNVSTKTIRRWRKRGLMSVRVIGDDGTCRMMFREATIERFVDQHQDLVERGAAFKQLSEAEKQNIVDMARKLLTKKRVKLHIVAKEVSEQTGRAVETVRYTLRRWDEEHPEEALFAVNGVPRLGRRHAAIWKAWRSGTPIEKIADRLELEYESVQQILCELQFRELHASPPSCVHNELFEAPNADDLILNIPRPQGQDKTMIRPPSGLPPYLRSLYGIPLLTAEQEQDLFRRYNYLKHKVIRKLDDTDPCAATPEDLAEIHGWMADSEDVRREIVQANLRLVVSIAKKHVGWTTNFLEVVSDGNMSLMRAVEKFDYSRGFKFSTYATWAVVKNYARSIPEAHYAINRCVSGQDGILESVSAETPDPSESSDRQSMTEMIKAGMEVLTEREREVVSEHFGLFGRTSSKTLEEIGKKYGVTKERVRQIEKKAIDKIRKVLSPDAADLIG